MATCAHCGAALAEGAKFCSACGTSAGTNRGAGPAGTTSSTFAGIAPNLAALLSYILWPVACILFLLLEPYSKDKFVRFHSFQALFFGLASAGIAIALSPVTTILGLIPVLGVILNFLLWAVYIVGLFGLVIFLMYKAFIGERFLLPWIGPLAVQRAEKSS